MRFSIILAIETVYLAKQRIVRAQLISCKQFKLFSVEPSPQSLQEYEESKRNVLLSLFLFSAILR